MNPTSQDYNLVVLKSFRYSLFVFIVKPKSSDIEYGSMQSLCAMSCLEQKYTSTIHKHRHTVRTIRNNAIIDLATCAYNRYVRAVLA